MSDPLARPARAVAVTAMVMAATGCGDTDVRTVRLVRIAPEGAADCGRPADGRSFLVRALGDFPASETTAEVVDLAGEMTFEIDRFPATTRALEVEVRGFGGALRAIGRTADVELAALEEGASVSIFMVPPRGACPTGAPAVARIDPLIARAGHEVMIAGGIGDDGLPVHEVEFYVPGEGRYRSAGEVLYGSTRPEEGLAGASLTELVDGRVVAAGGAVTAFQVFDPVADVFEPPGFLPEARAFHAAAALPDGRLLLAGGCSQVRDGACAPDTALSTTAILDPARGTIDNGPRLEQQRIGGTAFAAADGTVVLIGGVDADGAAVTVAERVDPVAGTDSRAYAGVAGSAVQLDSGALLAAFAAPGTEATDAAAVLSPRGSVTDVLTAGAPRSGAALVALEDGHALVVGGGPASPTLLREPLWGRWTEADAAGVINVDGGHRAQRLLDGSVLVVGGRRSDGSVNESSWIFRPDLSGPLSPSATFALSETGNTAILSPSDPGLVELDEADTGARLLLRPSNAEAQPSEWVVMSGPTFRDVVVEAAVASRDRAGVDLLFGWSEQDNYWAVELHPGERVAVVEVVAGARTELPDCRGDLLATEALDPRNGSPTTHEVVLSTDRGDLQVILDGDILVDCAGVDPPVGRIGVGVVGISEQLVEIGLVVASR